MKLILKGYVANFPNNGYKHYIPAANNSSAFCSLKINVPYTTSVKNESTGQYERVKKTDLINLTATGKSADLLNKFEPKQEIVCMAEYNGMNSYPGKEGKQFLSINAFLVELYTFADSINNSNVQPVNNIPEPALDNQQQGGYIPEPIQNNQQQGGYAPEPILDEIPKNLNLGNQQQSSINTPRDRRRR